MSWAQEEKIHLPKVSDHSPNGTSQEEMNVREKVALLPGEMEAGKPHSTTHLSHRMDPVCSRLPGLVGKECLCACVNVYVCLFQILTLLAPWAGGESVCVPVSVCVCTCMQAGGTQAEGQGPSPCTVNWQLESPGEGGGDKEDMNHRLAPSRGRVATTNLFTWVWVGGLLWQL